MGARRNALNRAVRTALRLTSTPARGAGGGGAVAKSYTLRSSLPPAVDTTYLDDSYRECPAIPFPFFLFGKQVDGVTDGAYPRSLYVNSNSHIDFNQPSTARSAINADVTGKPILVVSIADRATGQVGAISNGGIYAGAVDGGAAYAIRYAGFQNYSDQTQNFHIWEATFYPDNTIVLVTSPSFGVNPAAGGSGFSDGTQFISTFNPQPDSAYLFTPSDPATGTGWVIAKVR